MSCFHCYNKLTNQIRDALTILVILLPFSCSQGANISPDLGSQHYDRSIDIFGEKGSDFRKDGDNKNDFLIDAEADNGMFSDSCSSSSIFGDWFYCQDDECKKIDYRGIRINNDGSWTNLYAHFPTLETGEKYCYLTSDQLIGKYTWDGSKLVRESPKFEEKKLEEQWVFISESLIKGSNSEKSWIQKRVCPSVSPVPCKDWNPWICPVTNTLLGNICGQKWLCDNGLFGVICNNFDPKNVVCTCSKDNVSNNVVFEDSTFCEQGIADAMEIANNKCGFNIFVPF